MDYNHIDHLLLNVNKGPDARKISGTMTAEAPRPGDSVMVSLADRTLLSVLIHRADEGNKILWGETAGAVRDPEGREIISEGSRVCFSYQKLAGIHRR